MRRALCCVLAGAGLGLLAVGTAAATTAIGPDQQGWWSEVQQGPSPLPINTVTGNNLLVGNDPANGPNAVAALRFSVPGSVDGATVDPSTVPAVLTLQVAPNSNVGTVAVAACQVQANWTAAEGGEWGQRPNYSCSQGSALAKFSADDKTATFDLTPALQRSAGLYDLALVPTPGNTDPFSVEFMPAGGGSLALGVGTPPSSAGNTDQAAAAMPVAPDSGLPVAPDLSGALLGATASPLSQLPVTQAPSVAPAGRASNAQPFNAAPLRQVVPFKRGQRAVALGLLLALVAALWWFGGQQARSPRLLGSLGDGKEGVPDEVFLPSGGIGRFARPRTRPPVRL